MQRNWTPQIKIKLLLEFSRLIENREYRFDHIDSWLEDCTTVDGSTNDLDLVRNIKRVFNVFDSLKSNYQDQIIPAVSKMAKGMAHFQGRFQFGEITPLENEEDLEEYCYFVAGVVGEMLCDLFLSENDHTLRIGSKDNERKCGVFWTRVANDQYIKRRYGRS